MRIRPLLLALLSLVLACLPASWTLASTLNLSRRAAHAARSPAPSRKSILERSILEFGADPTGAKDSTASIQAALDAGGVVVIPPGHFLIRKTLEVRKSNTEIRGGDGSVLMIAADAAVSGILATSGDTLWSLHDVVIQGVTVLSPPNLMRPRQDAPLTTGVTFLGVRDGRIEDCTVRDFHQNDVCLTDCQNIHVTGCVTEGARHGIAVDGNAWIGGQDGSRNIQIDGCHTISPWDTGIVIGIHTKFTTVSHCVIEDSWCHGIDIFNCSDVVISGNTVHNWNALVPGFKQTTRSIGIFIHPDWGLTVAPTTRNVTVTGNLVLYDDPLAPGIEPAAMEVTGTVDGVNITGNTLIGSYQALLVREQIYDQYYMTRVNKVAPESPQAPQNIVFSSNLCQGQTGSGIEITSKIPVTALISNNTFAPADAATFAFDVPGKSTVLVSANVFRSGRITQDVLAHVTSSGNLLSTATQTVSK